MELYVKIFNGELIQVFNTRHDKKKRIILTTISDFQEEAEVEFHIGGKKVRTIIFTNLPPAKARILNLPVVIEMAPGHKLEFSYVGNDKKTERFEFNYKPYRSSPLTKNILVGGIIVGVLLFLTVPMIFLFRHLASNPLVSQKTTTTVESASNEDGSTTVTTLSNTDDADITTTTVAQKSEDLLTSTTVNDSNETTPLASLNDLKSVIEDNSPIYFVHDKDTLRKNETQKLNSICDELNKFNTVSLLIEGHTMKIGEPENELALSKKRAGKIKSIILGECSDVDITFTIKGYGSENPAIDNPDKTNRYKNRRVEIEVKSAK